MTNAFRFIKPESENAIQASFFQWTELQKGKHPELVLFHSIPNGSHKSPVSRMIYKATGLKSGVPDCFLPVARGKHHGLYIEFIYFNGGEPLLTNDHINLMEKISDKQSQRISLCYSTNGTIFPSEKVIALWSKFHEVKLQLSIDAVDKVIEYIRFPSSWHEIASNVQKLQKLNLNNLSISLSPNIGLHNLYYFEDLLQWASESNIEMIAFPTGHTFSVLNLPMHLKQSATSLLFNLQKKYPENEKTLESLIAYQ